MAVALRLMRFGKKGYPTYRIVALDKRSKRDGAYIEKVGLYNPMAATDQLNINEERLAHWMKNGAEISEGMRKLLSKQLPKSTRKVSKRVLKHTDRKKPEAPVVAEVKVKKTKETVEVAAEPIETPVEQTPAIETSEATEKSS